MSGASTFVHLGVVGGLGAVALLAARRLRWLTTGGAVAGLIVGAAILVGTGAGGIALLLFFFVTSSLLTGWRASAKTDAREHRAADRRADDRAGRSAGQVLANGGVAAGASLLGLAGWLPDAELALVGALAAATADTWATEVGTGRGGPTRRVVGWARVPPGASGGISAAGTLATLTGALLCGAFGAVLFPRSAAAPLAAGLLGGTVGSAVDSMIGATLERRFGWIGNDLVNLGCTLAGAVCGWGAAGWIPGPG